MEPISETAARLKATMQPDATPRPARPAPVVIPGKPLYSYRDDEIAHLAESCPTCGGIGYVDAGEVPLDDPLFGCLIRCPACREWTDEQRRRDSWRRFKDFIDATDCLGGDLLKCTFDNFRDETQHLAAVKAAVRTWGHRVYMQTDGKRWLYLCGGVGCGKTHLCAAAANGLRSVGVAVLFLTVPAMLGALRDDLDKTEGFIRQLTNVPVLVLDDLGTETLTEWAETILFRVVDGRYTHKRPLLISSNLALEKLGMERIASRIGGLAEIVVNTGKDWRR